MRTSPILFLTAVLLWGGSISLKSQTYEQLINQSFTLMNSKSYKEAEEVLIKALRMQPANAENGILLSNLGSMQRALGKYQEALVSYTSAIMMMPRSVALLKNRASLFCEIDSLNDAMADYTAAILLDEKDEECFYERGLLRLQMNDTTAAKKDFDKILEFKPGSGKARLGLAALGKYMGLYSESERLYSMVLTTNPNDANIYLNRAEIYFLTNRMGKAKDDIDRSIELSPDNPYAYLLRGKIKLKQYEKKSALSDLDKAVSLGIDREVVNQLVK